jgi:hypothetical protein
MKTLLTAIILLSISSVMAGESKKPDALAVDLACTQEAQTASCGNQKVRTGLLKCIHAYKKEHKKDFKISDGCKSALKTLREDRKEEKAEKTK